MTRTQPVMDSELLVLDAQLSHFILDVKAALEEFFAQQHAVTYSELSEREVDVLSWAASGKTAIETAKILNVSERTVNFHLGNCASKLKVRSKTQALLKAISLNIL